VRGIIVGLGVWLAAAVAVAAAPPTRLRGEVRERGTRSAVEGAAVIVLDAAGAELGRGESDAQGRFAVALPRELRGTFDVVIAAAGHKTSRLRETFGAAELVTVRYALSRTSYAQYESVVRAQPAREEVVRVSLSGDEVRRIPGTKGDALAAVLNLPSVARSPFDLGQLVIRGSAPGDSGAFFLGMAMPQAFHFGGLTSTFNSYLLDRFDLIPSNFSVRYGRFTGGVVDLVPRDGKRDRFHGDIKADLWDAHLIVEGPIGKGSFAISARRSYVGEIIGPFLGASSLTVAPRYYDYQAMLDYPVAGGKLKLVMFGSDDALELVSKQSPDNDPSLRGQFSTHDWFHILYATYRRTSHGGRLDWEATLAVGPQHADADIGQAARFTLDVIKADLRLEARWRWSPRLRLTAGLDVQSDYFWVNVDAPRPVTEEKVQGPLTADHVQLDNHGAESSPAVYAQADWWALRDRLLVTAGLRVDWLSGVPHTYLQPRVTARLRIARDTWLKAGAGLFHQPPQAPFNDPVLGNARIRAEEAWHFTVGIESRPIPRWNALKVACNLFYKDLRYIAVSSDQYLLQGGRIVPEVYSDEGIGRVYGADILIKHDHARSVYGWIAYTLLRSERQDHPGDPWRPFQFDQTNILTIVAGYHLPWDVDLGVRFRYVTGNPDTPLIAGIYDADRDVYTPVPGAAYSSRLPDFLQLDARVDKRFVFKSWILGVYLDVTNVTNRANVEGYSYSYDYRARREVNGLPILPSLGLRASF
jgi:hypothetical protein